MKPSATLAALSLFAVIAPLSAQTVIYQTDFDDPPFVDGINTWGGTDGWLTDDPSTGSQGILGGSPAYAYLGFNPPADNSTSVWRVLGYDPIAEGTPLVSVQTTLTVVDSTSAVYDDFYVLNFNDQNQIMGGILLDNTNLLILRYDGTSFVSTGVSFTNGSFQSLAYQINFANNTWSATWGGTPLFTNAAFNAGGVDLNLGDITYLWQITTPGSPGNNFLAVDNLTVTAIPEPSAVALLAVGLGGLFFSRRRIPKRKPTP